MKRISFTPDTRSKRPSRCLGPSHHAWRNWILVLVGLGFLFSTKAPAKSSLQGGDFGLGLYIGKPIGLAAQIWLTHNSSLKIVGLWSFTGNDGYLITDYEYHFWDPFGQSNKPRIRFNIYCGLGGAMRFGDLTTKDDDFEFRAALRIPVGFTVRWVNLPFDLFTEITPSVQIYDATEFELKGGIGGRFYF